MLLTTGKHQKITLLVFALAFLVRIYHLNIPFVEPYNSLTRQAIVATIARNFYQHGFNFFYPEIDENGRGPYLYNAEMPVCSYGMALIYKAVGGVREWAARSVSVFFSMGMLLFLYLFVRRLYDERLALYALIFASFSPLNVALSRSVQPDAAMLFASVGAIYTFYLYLDTKRMRHYFFSVLLAFFALATKLQAFYIFIPIFYLAWHTEREKAFSHYRNYAYLAAVSLVAIWYVAMWHVEKTSALAYKPYGYFQNSFFGGKGYFELFSLPHLQVMAKYFLIHILTPIGAVFFVAGFFQKAEEDKNKIFMVWFWAVIFYLLSFWSIAVDHSYYQLPLIPVAALFAAKGADAVIQKLAVRRSFVLNFLFCSLGALSLASLIYFYKGIYFIPDKQQRIVNAGRAVESLTPKDSLVIANYGTSTIQLYYCNRKGWAFDVRNSDEASLIQQLEKLRAQGASYFVSSSLEDLARAPLFRKYLTDRYAVIETTDDFILFDLRSKLSPS